MIILLGGSGYVGQAYQRLFTREGFPFRNVARRELDYGDTAALTALLRETGATFLLNAAGYTGKPNVDACESDKSACLAGNAVLPGNIRAACEAAAVPWGHVSSGCIYSGERPGGGWREEDAPNFSFRANHCSFYSGTKALGEEVLAGADNLYIWRLRIPFSEVDSPRNYLSKMMRYARLLDAANSLSQLDEFCRATFECWTRRVPFGTYNVTNPGQVTTREVVDLILESGVAGAGKEFSFFDDEGEFMAKAAKTPRSNCVLDTTKLEATGIQMTEVHAALAQALRGWVREEPKVAGV